MSNLIGTKWVHCGFALSERRAKEFAALKKASDAAGLETAFLGAAEAARRWPSMDFTRATSILWCASDGYMTPGRVVKAYEHQCRKRGVRFATETMVERLEVKDGQVTGVQTNRGSAACRYVINAAGAHAYHIARLAGLDLPIVPVRHEYFVTVAMPGLTPSHPCFRIPEWTLYGRVRDGGLLLGGWEPRSLHTDPRSYELPGQPPDVIPDWTVLEQFRDGVRKAVPGLSRRTKASGRQRLAHLHTGRPLYHWRKQPGQRVRHGGRLQRPWDLWLGWHRQAPARIALRPETVRLRQKPEPRPIHRNEVDLG
jgi:glycine/D-amino acid oxidase-like deaminating enzyme